jgi:tellurite resistance protein
MLDAHGALIYTMVIVSAADANVPDAEFQLIGDIIGQLPVFHGFDRKALPRVLNGCTRALGRDNGLEVTLDEISAALPPKLHETAYAIACDLVASDGEASQEELRLLELIRHRLHVDRLTAAAIERGARARFQTL